MSKSIYVYMGRFTSTVPSRCPKPITSEKVMQGLIFSLNCSSRGDFEKKKQYGEYKMGA